MEAFVRDRTVFIEKQRLTTRHLMPKSEWVEVGEEIFDEDYTFFY